MHYGKKLKDIRVQLRLSQAEFGECLGESQQTISNWENGKSEIPITIADKIAIKIDYQAFYYLFSLNTKPFTDKDHATICRNRMIGGN